ncbi:phasin family protein [Capilliphycus salinus ALCB114379]|uniref:phasin family protein n=1 Tax=Capilliphycus salinus TaxID=2768948 RepID=UPI0039A55209
MQRGLGDLVQKAVYLGVGLAAYAGEKAAKNMAELRTEAQKLADELVKRGEMTAEEARRFVEDTLKQAQQQPPQTKTPTKNPPEPRQIEIIDGEEDEPQSADSAEQLRQQVENLREELRRLKRE